jgi:hypothetical protein
MKIGSNLDSLGALPLRASNYVVKSGLLFSKWSPAALDLALKRYIWSDARQDVRVKELWEVFSTDLRLPRLRDANTLLEAIRDGAPTKDYFGYATSTNTRGGYAGLAYGRPISNVFLDDLGVVVRPDIADAALPRISPP